LLCFHLPWTDATTLGAYLGNADLTALGDAAAAALAAAGEVSSPGAAGRSSLPGAASGEADFLANLDNLVALSSRAGAWVGGCIVVGACLLLDGNIVYLKTVYADVLVQKHNRLTTPP
jgi:hypothetical protein